MLMPLQEVPLVTHPHGRVFHRATIKPCGQTPG